MSAIFFFLPAFNTIILSMFCNVYLIYTCLKSAKPKSTQQSSPSQINPASAKTKKMYKFHQQTNDKLTPLLALWNNPLFSMFEKLQDTSPTPTKATIKGHPALMKKKKTWDTSNHSHNPLLPKMRRQLLSSDLSSIKESTYYPTNRYTKMSYLLWSSRVVLKQFYSTDHLILKY